MRTRTTARRLAGLAAILLLVLGSLVPPAADAREQNNHTAVFLRSGVGARYLSLGGLGAAIADDIYAAYWNPAGLAMIRGWSLTAMGTAGLDYDRRHGYVAGAWGGERFALALSWISAGTGSIPRTDDQGTVEGEFGFNENAIMGSIGGRAGGASMGASVKLVTQDLGTDSPVPDGSANAAGFGLDVGAQYVITEFARVGLAIQDVFGHVGNVDDSRVDQIPSNMRFGLGLEFVDGFLLAADLEKARDDSRVLFRLGTEFEVPLGASTAGAVRLGLSDGKARGGLGFTLGAFTLDYAYVIEQEAFLGENHVFSLAVDFGAKRELYREDGSLDRDGDGFPDDEDACPDDPEDFDGYDDFDGCPDLDNDADGVGDLDDFCPEEAEDFDGFQDDDGCPDLDNDGDGIADVNDQCPGEAEVVNGFEDEDGCPDEASIDFPVARIQFASGSTQLPPGQLPSLEDVVRILREYPDLRVEIQGHTDSQGGPAQNRRLSEMRAQSVREYLIGRGIQPARLEVRGFGDSQPIDTNATPEGRARNRRITFELIEP